jgi:hypothetical protein
MIGVDAIVLDIPGAKHESNSDGIRTWRMPDDDGIALYCFHKLSCLPGAPNQVGLWRNYYRSRSERFGGLVSVDAVRIDSCPAVKAILRRPQHLHGKTYIGLITIPFRDFSFMLKVECQEAAPTGFREAMVCILLGIEQSNVPLDRAENAQPTSDLHDPKRLKSLSEDVQYDSMFPDHPLSRARRLLIQIETVSRRTAEVKTACPYR